MGLLSRVSTIFKSKVNTVLDKAEDPRETLEYSYQKQVEQLQTIRRGVAEVVTSKKRIELQRDRLQQQIGQWEQDARDAVSAGRDDLATQAITRKQAVESQLSGLDKQIDDLAREEARLMDLQEKLKATVENFRTQKEVIKAQYSAAQAQVRIGEATSGLGEDMADLHLALERAQDKTQALQARAAAIDEIAENTGGLALESGSGDSVRDELNKMRANSGVSDELARLKAELSQGDEQ
jgi:phage shock protein A